MRLIHLLSKHWEPPFTGVNRFSRDFARAFPDVVNITPESAWTWEKGDVVVTDNHLCLQVPDTIPCIVVHHGCAPAHYQKDTSWRSPATQKMAADQVLMFSRPRTLWVAPSTWVARQFATWAGQPADYADVVPHWVCPIQKAPLRFGMPEGQLRPHVIGDWRNWNKGAEHWRKVARLVPEADFCQLDFRGDDDVRRVNTYASARVYLCLSQSEGGPYSVADAEAAGLPIVTTWTGYALDFPGQRILQSREDPQQVAGQVRLALVGGRPEPSFYASYTWDLWRERWQGIIARAGAL